jgi:hypothetical protein
MMETDHKRAEWGKLSRCRSYYIRMSVNSEVVMCIARLAVKYSLMG